MSHGTASVAPVDPFRVADDVVIHGFGGPAAGARPDDNGRHWIEFSVPELRPWYVRFEFLIYSRPPSIATTGRIIRSMRPVEYEYVPCGFGLHRLISIAHSEAEPDAIESRYIEVSDHFAKHVASYTHQAELLLRSNRRDEVAEVRRAMAGRKAHKNHALLVDVYRSLPSKRGGGRIDRMAEEFGVRRETINKELRLAAEAGRISWSELELRKPRS